MSCMFGMKLNYEILSEMRQGTQGRTTDSLYVWPRNRSAGRGYTLNRTLYERSYMANTLSQHLRCELETCTAGLPAGNNRGRAMKACLRCGEKLKKSPNRKYWRCLSCNMQFRPERWMGELLAYMYFKEGFYVWQEVPKGCLGVFSWEEL